MTSLQKPEPNPDLTSTALSRQGVDGQLFSLALRSLLFKNDHQKSVYLEVQVVTHAFQQTVQ